MPAETAGADAMKESAGVAAIGSPAPDLSIQTLNGRGTISLSSLAGKIAIVEFFSKSCVPCKKSFPALDELAKRSDGRIKVVAISVDDSKDGVLQFASVNGATFPIGWDEGHSAAARWKVEKGGPTSFVIDGSGTVRFVHENYGDDEQELLTRELAFLNSEPPPATGGSTNAVASSGGGGPSPFDSGGKSAGAGGGAGKASASDTSGDAADEAPVATKPGKKKGGGGGGGAGKAKPAKKAGKKKKAA